MISLSTQVEVPEDVLVQQVEGQSALLHLGSEQYFGLDEVGTRMWEAITTADGRLTDAAAEGFETVRSLNDPDRINAVVLLTDGEDTDSQRSFQDAVNALKAQGDSENRVRVFTIAYSAGAAGAREQLADLAAASGGQSYEGKTENIESVYRSISSFF